MRANLDLTDGLLLAERVVAALAPAVGRVAAHELVDRRGRGGVRRETVVRRGARSIVPRWRSTSVGRRDRASPGPGRLPGEHATRSSIARSMAARERIGRIVSPGVSPSHHVVEGPGGRSRARAVELAREHARDVGPADGRARPASARDPLRPPRPRQRRRSRRPRTTSRISARDLLALLDRAGRRPRARLRPVDRRPDRHVGRRQRSRARRPPGRCAARRRGSNRRRRGRRARRRCSREGTGAVADAVVARWFTPAFADELPAWSREMRDMIAAHACRRLRRAAAASSSGRTSARACPRSDAPTLVIAGADDPAAPPAQAELIASRHPRRTTGRGRARRAPGERRAARPGERPHPGAPAARPDLAASGEDALTKEAP